MRVLYRLLAEVMWVTPLDRVLAVCSEGDPELSRVQVEVLAGMNDEGTAMALSFKSPDESNSNLEKACTIVQGRLSCGRPNRVLPPLPPSSLASYLVDAAEDLESPEIRGLPRLSYLPSWLDLLADAIIMGEMWVAFQPRFCECETLRALIKDYQEGEVSLLNQIVELKEVLRETELRSEMEIEEL